MTSINDNTLSITICNNQQEINTNTEPVVAIEDINLENSFTLTSVDEEEWKQVPIVFERLDSSILNSSLNNRFYKPQKSELISFERFCENLLSENATASCTNRTESRRSNIKDFSSKSKIERLEKLIFGPPALKSDLRACRDLVISLSQTPFDDNDTNHRNMLKTIYTRLTNSSVYHRYGSHWETIGFQGNDPVTDLRGCGILSLILLLYAVEFNSPHSQLIQNIYLLSHSEAQHFPFCLVAINLTGLILDAIRKDYLNTCLNRIKLEADCETNETSSREIAFLNMCGKFLVALLFDFYLEWKNNNKTVQEFGFVLKDLEKTLKKTPKSLIRNLDAYFSDGIEKRCDKSLHKKIKKKAKKEKEVLDLEFSILE